MQGRAGCFYPHRRHIAARGQPRDTGTCAAARRGIRVHCAAARRGIRVHCCVGPPRDTGHFALRPAAGCGNAARRPAAGRRYAALWPAVADERSGSKAAFRSAGVRLCTPAAAGLKKISESQSKGARAYAARPRNWALRCSGAAGRRKKRAAAGSRPAAFKCAPPAPLPSGRYPAVRSRGNDRGG